MLKCIKVETNKNYCHCLLAAVQSIQKVYIHRKHEIHFQNNLKYITATIKTHRALNLDILLEWVRTHMC